MEQLAYHPVLGMMSCRWQLVHPRRSRANFSGQHPISRPESLSRLLFLSRGQRRGDIEEHAVLLCSLLLGFGLESYVCLGSKRAVMGTSSKQYSNFLLDVISNIPLNFVGYTVDGSSISSVHAWVMTFTPDSEVSYIRNAEKRQNEVKRIQQLNRLTPVCRWSFGIR